MIFTNHLGTLKKIDKEILHQFLILLNPFSPHITEELNQKIGYGPITAANWPKYEESILVNEKITIAVQFKGKTRGTIDIVLDASEEMVMNLVKKTSFGKKYLSQGQIIKIIYIPKRIINIIISND